MKPLVLVGMPAVGKTTVGRRIARSLNVSFLDTDNMMEALAGRSVGDIIKSWGERDFRELESETLRRAIGSANGGVIATGAGIVEEPTNRESLVTSCDAVCLFAPLYVLIERMAGDCTRPLWNGPDGEVALRARWAKRAPLYQQVARITVNATVDSAWVADRVMHDSRWLTT